MTGTVLCFCQMMLRNCLILSLVLLFEWMLLEESLSTEDTFLLAELWMLCS